MAFGASILAFWALRGGILLLFVAFWFTLCGLLRLQGGYPFALCGLLSLQGGYPWVLCGLLSLQKGYPSQLRASARGVSPPPHKLPKMVRFPKLPYKEFISAVAGSIFQFLAFWALIFFILALRAFISCYFAFLVFILAFGPLIWPLGL